MSISSSNLGSSVNIAVATTLDAINSTMFEYLYEQQLPVINYCWVQLETGGAYVPISLDDLMTLPVSQGGTNGTNPFTVPTWQSGDPLTQDISNLQNSNFACGIQLQLGIPPGMAMPGGENPAGLPVLPPILTVNSTNTNTAVFNMLCSQYQVCFAAWGNHGSYAFNNDSQPSGSAWLTTVDVPLKTLVVPPGIDTLPPAVLNQLKILGEDLFSIQQLFLEFASAILSGTPPFISGFPPEVQNLITSQMVQKVFENNLNQGLSILGYTLTQNDPNLLPSTLSIGSLTQVFDQYSPPSSGTAGLSTLNYLCNQGSTPPPQNYSGIDWNWIDSGSSATQYDGAVAISSDVFIPYFATLLEPFVQANCNTPIMSAYYHIAELHFEYGIQSSPAPGYTSGTDGNIINYTFNSGTVETSCGHHGLLDYYKYESYINYSMTVTVNGNQVTIVQQLVVYASVEWESSATEWSGNYIDTTITQVYTLSAGAGGTLLFSSAPPITSENGQQPPSNIAANLLLGIKQMTDCINKAVQMTTANLGAIPAASINTFVFPGGQTFSFAEPQFSQSNDLVSYITYNNPSS